MEIGPKELLGCSVPCILTEGSMKNCRMEISFLVTFTFTAAGLVESVECMTLTFTFMGGQGFDSRDRSGSRIFPRRGAPVRKYHFNYHFCGVYHKFFNLVSCFTSTPINHKDFFCRIPVVLESHGSSQGWGCPPPAPFLWDRINSQDLKITEE